MLYIYGECHEMLNFHFCVISQPHLLYSGSYNVSAELTLYYIMLALDLLWIIQYNVSAGLTLEYII